MKSIPKTNDALVLRTDFSSDPAWEAIRAAVEKPVAVFRAGIEKPIGLFRANVEFVSDPEYDQLSLEQLLSLIPADYPHTFIFIVDAIALSHPESPILVVDLYTERGRTFRVIPSEMWGVENNLSIANMDYSEFADDVDPDGIFRGFPSI